MPRQAQLGSPALFIMSLPEGNEERISEMRMQMAMELKEGYGLTLAEEGGQPGVSKWATSRICMRNSVKIS